VIGTKTGRQHAVGLLRALDAIDGIIDRMKPSGPDKGNCNSADRRI